MHAKNTKLVADRFLLLPAAATVTDQTIRAIAQIIRKSLLS